MLKDKYLFKPVSISSALYTSVSWVLDGLIKNILCRVEYLLICHPLPASCVALSLFSLHRYLHKEVPLLYTESSICLWVYT